MITSRLLSARHCGHRKGQEPEIPDVVETVFYILRKVCMCAHSVRVFICMCTCVCVCVYVCPQPRCRGQRPSCWNQFSLGIKLGSSSLVASTLPAKPFSLAHPCDTSGLTGTSACGFAHLCSLPTAVGCPGACGVVRSTQWPCSVQTGL